MKRDPLDVLETCPRPWGNRPTVALDGAPIQFAPTVESRPIRLKAAYQWAKTHLDFDGYLDFGPGFEYVQVQAGCVRVMMDRDVVSPVGV